MELSPQNQPRRSFTLGLLGSVGLPWQAVHDGTKLQHEPLRLTVIIDASRERVAAILDRHSGVRDLVTHNWLRLVVEDAGACYRWTPTAGWKLL